MSDRFPVSPSAMEICKETIEQWASTHFPGHDFSEPVNMLAARVNSWVSGISVVAGVRDVMSSHLKQTESTNAAIEELGNRLGRRLGDEGLLIASPRRSGSLG